MNERFTSMLNLLIMPCMVLGFMISPLSLVILGNALGHWGSRMLWTLPLFALIHLWTAQLHAEYVHRTIHSDAKRTTIPAGKFAHALATLQLSSLVPMCLGASTLILAMAGYALNEIFAYWIPNLLFSILLLVFIAGVNFTSPALSRHLQGVAVLTFLVAVCLLMLQALFFAQPAPADVTQASSGTTSLEWRPFLMVFWLFMAAELSLYQQATLEDRRVPLSTLNVAFALSVAVFWLWAQTSLNFTSTERLAQTTLPHLMTARTIAGNIGRKLMGIAILTGSYAAVNILLTGISSVMLFLVRTQHLPQPLEKPIFGGNMGLLLLFAAVLCMLLTGMAGKEITEIGTRAAFYLWLLSYAALNVLAGTSIYSSGSRRSASLRWVGFSAALLYAVAFLVLLATEPDLPIVLFIILGSLTASALAVGIARHRRQRPGGAGTRASP